MHTELSVSQPDGPLFREGREIVNQEIDRLLHTLAAEFERRVRVLTPVGVGGGSGLQGSIAGEVRGLPAREAVIGTPMVHGVIVENGRHPGPISADGQAAIELWVRRKLAPKLGTPEEEIPDLVMGVIWKIRKRGFAGAHMFQRAFEAGQAMVQDQAEQAGVRIAERLSGRGPGGEA